MKKIEDFSLKSRLGGIIIIATIFLLLPFACQAVGMGEAGWGLCFAQTPFAFWSGNQFPNGYADAQAYINRVKADGGTIIDSAGLVEDIIQANTDGWFAKDGSLFWVSASFGVKYNTGSLISKEYDVFGNDITYAASYQPTINLTGGPNSKPTIVFNQHAYGSFTQISLGNTHTIYDVMLQNSTGDLMLYGKSTTDFYEIYSGGGGTDNINYCASGSCGNFNINSVYNMNIIFSCERPGTNRVTFYKNNTTLGTLNDSGALNFTLFSAYNNGSLPFKGNRSETIISTNDISGYQSKILSYLNTKYAIY